MAIQFFVTASPEGARQSRVLLAVPDFWLSWIAASAAPPRNDGVGRVGYALRNDGVGRVGYAPRNDGVGRVGYAPRNDEVGRVVAALCS